MKENFVKFKIFLIIYKYNVSFNFWEIRTDGNSGLQRSYKNFFLTKCSLINELRNFCKRRFFVKLKISILSTFWKNGQPEKVVYSGATKNFVKQNVLILMN